MRARIVLGLLVLLGLLSFVRSAGAQSNPIPSPSPQQGPEKVLPTAKPLPLPLVTNFELLPYQNSSATDHTIKLQELKTWIERLQNQRDGLAKNLQRFGDGPDAPNCAHIRIIQAPEMDSEMVVQMSPGDGGPIQTFQGLPPCRRDLPAPIIVQRFYGVPPVLQIPSRNPFVLRPAAQIPFAQHAQPKTDAPGPKP